MMRALTLLLLFGIVSAHGQAYLSRAELKKPLSEAVEKTLAEFVEKCAEEKRKQLTTHMETVIAAVDASAKLTDEEKKALDEPARRAVDAAVKAWVPVGTVAMRTYLSRTSETASTRHIGQWKPEQAGPNEPVEDWTPPQEDAAWLAALEKTLGENRFKVWQAADAKKQAEEEKEIQGYLERWVRESRGAMNEDLEEKIGQMKSKMELAEDKVTALKEVADGLLDKICTAERKRAFGMLRTMPPEARSKIMGRSYFYVRFDRPRGDVWDRQWEQTAAKVLPKEEIMRWRAIAEEAKREEEEELAKLIKPSEIYARQQMERQMLTEMDNITTELSVDKARLEELKKLSDAAIEEALKLGRVQWMKQVRNYSAVERKRMGSNAYFGLSDEQRASSLPVWKDGLKKVLSEEEMSLMAEGMEQREQRSLRAIARACLAEMDQSLMLNDAQRAKLEPLVRKQMEPLLEQRRQEYWSYSPQQLFQNAGKIPEPEVRGILDDQQWRRWQVLTNIPSNSRSNVAAKDTKAKIDDMEAAVSAHLYEMFVAERQKVLDTMMPHVEEAGRVLNLSKDTLAELKTAAKGAVEQSLDYWRQNTERYVRQAVQTATPQNILQALAGTERVNFSRRGDENRPENMEVWQSALKNKLDEVQLRTLKEMAEGRNDYRQRAMAAMTVAELDRRRRLNGEQCAKLAPLMEKVLAEYRPDIERYMSTNWFLQYYYALVPMAGVEEKDMAAILTPEQLKHFKDRDLPDAMQYWEGIENNHKNRMKKGVRNEVNF
ncbi:MAG: hypothetical protein R3F13_10340 [Prosthecobacter sp.]